jgi:D-serine deaminase-like pyridoxal phosphate-dependent protein
VQLSYYLHGFDPSILPPAFYEKNAKLLSLLGIDPPSAGVGIREKNPAQNLEEAARPIRCAITISEAPERCGAEYDKTQVDMILAKTVDFVGKAIDPLRSLRK